MSNAKADNYLKKYFDGSPDQDIPLDQLPRPVGSSLLVKPIGLLQETLTSGLEIIEEVATIDAVQSIKGKVLAMGPSCYKGKRFSDIYGDNMPWCAVGDIVQYKRMAGCVVYGTKGKYQFIDDQMIQAVFPKEEK